MGTAMGTKMAPPYAILFLADLEDIFLSNCVRKPSLYVRYIDDIFMLWTHGDDALIEFYDSLNGVHPSIRFTMDHSREHISFLDTLVSIAHNRISTRVYHKPTDRNTFLHEQSFHPDHVKRSIVYSQGLRFRRICTEDRQLHEELGQLSAKFVDRGYDANFVGDILHRINTIPRQQLLASDGNHRDHPHHVPFITTYHPGINRTLRKIVHSLEPMLHDESLGDIFKDPPWS